MTQSTDVWQLFPPLASEEYDALKADIAVRGVLVPVEYDEHGDILDGHHRVRACGELGIKDWPRVIRGGMDDDAKFEHVLLVNSARRHLNSGQKRDLGVGCWERGWSQTRIAKVLGVGQATVSGWFAGYRNRYPDRSPERSIGEDGKSYPTTVNKTDDDQHDDLVLELEDEEEPDEAKPPSSVYVASGKDHKRAAEAVQHLGDDSAGKSYDVNGAARAARKNTSGNDGDEWYTPRWLFDALGLVYDLDVCSPADRTHVNVPTAQFYTADDDGLAQPWHGTVWCNPPYSDPEPWARKMIEHGSGLLLVHMPMNAGWCVDVWHSCDGIRLFQALEFVRPDGSTQRPGYWLQLAAFGPVAAQALADLKVPDNVATNIRRVPSPMWKATA